MLLFQFYIFLKFYFRASVRFYLCVSCLFFHLLLNLIDVKVLIYTPVILKTFFTWGKGRNNLCDKWTKFVTIWKLTLNSCVLSGVCSEAMTGIMHSVGLCLCSALVQMAGRRPNVGSWPTGHKSGKLNSEQESREAWALIRVSRGRCSFSVLCFLLL